MALIWAAAGVKKIRLTGGEPTLCDDLPEFVAHARSLVNVVGMTTNGVLLEPMLPALQAAGLNRLNISLDALDGEGFRKFSRRDGLDRVLSAIRAARRFGFAPLKINAVAMPDTDYAMLTRFAAWEGVHVRFIELMAIGEARAFQPTAHVTADAMRQRIFDAGIRLTQRTDRDEPTSRVWAIDEHDPSTCSVGFITTVSQPFCATCDRLRLSAQGRLFTCLMDNTGHDLLTALRAGDEDAVKATVITAVRGKKPPLSFVRHENMAAIGG
jgi:cyclic pyranopterin phosphate synthase